MRSVLAAVAGTAVLGLSAVAASAQSATYEEAFEYARMNLAGAAETLDGIESPSKEQAAARRAVAKADAILAKALDRPSPLGFVKSSAKVNGLLLPFRHAEGTGGWFDYTIQVLTSQVLSALVQEIQDFQEQASLLPEGADADLLVDSLQSLVDEALAFSGSVTDAHRMLTSVATRLQGLRRQHLRLVKAAAGKPGMYAEVNGSPWTPEEVTGTMTVDPATGTVLSIFISGITYGGPPGESVSMSIVLTGDPVSARAFGLGGGATAIFADQVGRDYNLRILGNEGVVTLLAHDVRTGSAWGTFSFTGPAIGFEASSPTGEVVAGRFHIRKMTIEESVIN